MRMETELFIALVEIVKEIYMANKGCLIRTIYVESDSVIQVWIHDEYSIRIDVELVMHALDVQQHCWLSFKRVAEW